VVLRVKDVVTEIAGKPGLREPENPRHVDYHVRTSLDFPWRDRTGVLFRNTFVYE